MVDQNNTKGMKENIYIKALEIGFKNETSGISFNEVVKELEIEENLKDTPFKVNFLLWFYTNFYCCSVVEKLAMNSATGGNFLDAVYRISEESITKLDKYSSTKSFIKGEATQKYIDYLELKEARESSQIAKKISYASIFIAICSIIVSPIVSNYLSESPTPVIVTNRDDSNDLIYQKLTEMDSTINLVVKGFNQTKLKQLVVTAPKK